MKANSLSIWDSDEEFKTSPTELKNLCRCTPALLPNFVWLREQHWTFRDAPGTENGRRGTEMTGPANGPVCHRAPELTEHSQSKGQATLTLH